MCYKVYSSVLNKGLVNYFDLVDAFVDEQNGFRSQRSGLDHVLYHWLLLEKDYRREAYICSICGSTESVWLGES